MNSLSLAAIATCVVCFSVAAQSPTVTFVPHDKVATAIAKGGSLVTAPNLSVSGAERHGPGQVEVHDKETDVLYILDGAATFVTGGSMVGAKTTAPGQSRGTDIQGGESRQLTKGDVIVIPAGVPHWFKEVPKSVNYYVVKVIKE
jgi:mannose-6-phosphate isomerase-like protein (cupin superfamily)